MSEAPLLSSVWKVEAAGDQDEEELLDLFARVFGHPISREHWRWKYLAADPWGMLVRFEDRIVAFYGGIPRPILLFGSSMLAVQVGDVMSDLDLRHGLIRRGPFFLAASAFLEQFIGPGKRYRLGFGFPSKRAYRLAEHLGLYSGVGEVMEASWSSIVALPEFALKVRVIGDEPTEVVDVLWQEMASDSSDLIVPVRDGAFIRQRFLEHPTVSYLVFLVRWRWSGQPFGLLVLRDHGETGGVELLDLVAPHDRLPTLVQIGRKITRRLGRSRLFSWVTAPVLTAISDTEPQISATEVYIPTSVWKIPDDDVERIRGRWWLMGGDADFR